MKGVDPHNYLIELVGRVGIEPTTKRLRALAGSSTPTFELDVHDAHPAEFAPESSGQLTPARAGALCTGVQDFGVTSTRNSKRGGLRRFQHAPVTSFPGKERVIAARRPWSPSFTLRYQ